MKNLFLIIACALPLFLCGCVQGAGSGSGPGYQYGYTYGGVGFPP